MRKLLFTILLAFPLFATAQSIEVKYSVYSKKRAEVVNKMKERKENQGHQGLLSDLSAEKKDSFCLVIKGRMSSFEKIEPEEELSDNRGPKIILVGPSYSEESVSVYKNLEDLSVSTETKIIMGLQAHKATLGDSITAWFCPTIPVQEGPGLYHGLPGLILDLEDSQAIYSCTAINTNSSHEVGKAKRAKEVTEEEFEQLRQRALSR